MVLELLQTTNLIQAYYSLNPGERLNAQGEGLLNLITLDDATTPETFIYNLDECLWDNEEAIKAALQILSKLLIALLGEICQGIHVATNGKQLRINPIFHEKNLEKLLKRAYRDVNLTDKYFNKES